MNFRRHLAPLGLSFALLTACGSKDKDVVASAESAAQSDAGEGSDAGEDAGEGAAAAAAAVGDDDDAATKKRDRTAKLADGGSIRDRRNERLVRRAGDDVADENGTVLPKSPLADAKNPGGGPRIVKPTRPLPVDREGPVDGSAPGEAVAVPSAGAGAATPPAEGTPVVVENAAATPGKGSPEGPAALAELVPPAPGKNPALAAGIQPPDVKRILPLTVAAEIIGQKSLKEQGPLPGIATVSGYGSFHYGVSADRFGVAIQVWNDATLRETEDRFRRMRLQQTNAEDVEAMKPVKGFYSGYMSIQSLTFVRPDKQLVYTVSCGEGVCDHARLLRLARAVDGRL